MSTTPVPSPSRLARPGAVAGVFYLITHLTSVGAVALYGPLLTDDAWLASGADGSPQLVGAMLDVILAAAIIGTGVVLYPWLRRLAPAAAFGYAALRTAEAAVVLVGAAAVMAAIKLASATEGVSSGDGPGATSALIELYRQAFTVGPGLIVGVHTVLLAITLRKHALVAGWIPWLGLVGAPLVTVSNLAIIFGLQDQVAPTALLAAVPVFAWEISLAIFLIARGLKVKVTA